VSDASAFNASCWAKTSLKPPCAKFPPGPQPFGFCIRKADHEAAGIQAVNHDSEASRGIGQQLQSLADITPLRLEDESRPTRRKITLRPGSAADERTRSRRADRDLFSDAHRDFR